MPELPEVETIMRGLSPHLENTMIMDVIVRQDKLRWPISPMLKEHLLQQKIVQLSRRGKYLLLHVTNGTLIMHLGMSGRLQIQNNTTPPTRHDHVDIFFGDAYLLRYNDPRRFGAIIWTEADPLQHHLLRSLGIEPLSEGFTGEYLKKQAQNRRVAIKSFIMNSHVVTGIGNIYAAEALFLAKIHPIQPAETLTEAQCIELVNAIKIILKAAIHQGGTTIKDFINSEGKPGYFTQQLRVYGRGGKPCLVCHAPLRTMQLGQRSTVFCDFCQCLIDD